MLSNIYAQAEKSSIFCWTSADYTKTESKLLECLRNILWEKKKNIYIYIYSLLLKYISNSKNKQKIENGNNDSYIPITTHKPLSRYI